MSTITAERPSTSTDLPLSRLHPMRAVYLLLGLGLAIVEWPLIIDGADSLPLFEGVVAYLLTAMSLLALLGVRFPVKLLPGRRDPRGDPVAVRMAHLRARPWGSVAMSSS